MSTFAAGLPTLLAGYGERCVMRDGLRAVHPAEAQDALAAIAEVAAPGSVVASCLDNGVEALLLDWGLRAAGAVHVALPPYFTPAQVQHALDDAGADCFVSASPALRPGWRSQPLPAALPGLFATRRPAPPACLPAGTVCVTYTSGSTGAPKGVCLSEHSLTTVAESLAQAFHALPLQRHLCALPLATLLEAVGCQAAALRGATIVLRPLAELGYSGASGLDVTRFHAALDEAAADSLILVPQLLDGLLAGIAQHGPLRHRPGMIAVGGAAVPARSRAAALAAGLPVFEGYGLSEAASVVCLNRPGACRDGSVGRPLPHITLRIAEDGEVWIRGGACLPRDGATPPMDAEGWWPSGDLGELDADGFLFLRGRKRNVFITAYGRNVSPEWIEAELRTLPGVRHALVVGEARPWNLAVLSGTPPQGTAGFQDALDALNTRLPDYARIARVIWADPPFGAFPDELTGNGRLRREPLLARFAATIEAAYAKASLLLPPSEPGVSPMSFHQQLLDRTAAARGELQTLPIVQRALRGGIDRATYAAFLGEAFQHVRHTVPLLMACGARLPARLEWLRSAIAHYIEEEIGHHEWILDDLVAMGESRAHWEQRAPSLETELMVAYAYDLIARGNPVGFFGMVLVLEGTSVALALHAADAIERCLGLPRNAFTYLRSHGELDQEHTGFFEELMDRLDEPADREAVVQAAQRFYRLYGNIFRALDVPAPTLAEAA